MKHPILILLIAALLAAAMPPTAGASAPDNYCTTVTVDPVASGYNVNATGAGRYARIRDLTAAQTVVATDFGAGATAYQWLAVALDPSHNYQVQVSHTSLTTGYSTAGCLFIPPPPLAVVLAGFEAVQQGQAVLVTWETVSEFGTTGFNLYRSDAEAGPQALLAAVPAQAPGGTAGAAYSYEDLAVQAGATYWYWLEDVDLNGAATLHGPAWATVQAPAAVTLASFTAARKLNCYWTGRHPAYACICGNVAVPALFCGKRPR